MTIATIRNAGHAASWAPWTSCMERGGGMTDPMMMPPVLMLSIAMMSM